MSSYTDEEIQATVEKLVVSTIRNERDTLGPRKMDARWQDFQSSAVGAFLFNSGAPHYCVALGAKYLKESVLAEELVVTELLTNITACGRHVIPVSDITPIKNASVSLFALEGALAKGTPNIEKNPAYQQFTSQVGKFLNTVGGNVKDAGSIVPTPDEARAKLPTLISDWKAAHDAVVLYTTYLAAALDDYGSVNLASLVALGVISNSRALLGQWAVDLEGMSETERLASLRALVLDVLGTQSVVNRFGVTPDSSLTVIGTAVPTSSTTQPADEAEVLGNTHGPYVIYAGANQLDLTLNGGGVTSIILPNSFVCSLDGTISESATDGRFAIGDGINPVVLAPCPHNDTLHLEIGDYSGVLHDVVIPITIGTMLVPRRTTQQICDDINARFVAMAITGFVAEPYFSPLRFSGSAARTAIGGGARFTVAVGDFTTVGLSPGDIVRDVTASEDYVITVINTLFIEGTGVVPVAGPVTVSIEAGSANRNVRVKSTDPSTAVPDRQYIAVRANNTVEANTASTLGFFVGTISRSRPSKAQEIADYIVSKTKLARAEVSFAAALSATTGHTIAGSVTKVVFPKLQGVGDVVAVGFNITITGPVGSTAIGDKLVLRDGPDPGTLWTVTGVTATTIAATGPGTSSTLAVAYEVGESTPVAVGMTVRITEGGNTGRFEVASVTSIPFEAVLASVLPAPFDAQGEAVSFAAQVGWDSVKFFSTDTTTASSISVDGTAAASFSSVVPFAGSGTTKFLSLPSVPSNAKEGDVLELYTTSYSPSSTISVVTLDKTTKVMELESSVSSTTSWNMTDGVALPYAKLKSAHALSFDEFKADLATWSGRVVSDAYFKDLSRLINPLISSKNPAQYEMDAASNKVMDLYKYLTSKGAVLGGITTSTALESILDSFEVDKIDSIDVLMKSLIDKGSQRGVDLLLQGRFSEFFGLTQETSSYAGAVSDALKGIMQSDLPVRRANREEATRSRVTTSYESPDPDFDRSDLDPTPAVDPPVASDDV